MLCSSGASMSVAEPARPDTPASVDTPGGSYFRDTPETPSDGLIGTTLTLSNPVCLELMHRISSGTEVLAGMRHGRVGIGLPTGRMVYRVDGAPMLLPMLQSCFVRNSRSTGSSNSLCTGSAKAGTSSRRRTGERKRESLHTRSLPDFSRRSFTCYA